VVSVCWSEIAIDKVMTISDILRSAAFVFPISLFSPEEGSLSSVRLFFARRLESPSADLNHPTPCLMIIWYGIFSFPPSPPPQLLSLLSDLDYTTADPSNDLQSWPETN